MRRLSASLRGSGRLALGLIASVALLAASNVPAWARSLKAIQASGEIRVCISPAHPALASSQPPGCRDDCTFSGPVYDTVMAFVAHLGSGIQPRLIRVDWDEQFHNEAGQTDREGSYTPALLASGTCDVYPTHLTKNAWRSKKLDFVTLFPSRFVVLVHEKNRRHYKKLADLAGKVAALEKDTASHTWMQQQIESTLKANPAHIELMGTTEAIEAVAVGKADFTLMDADMAMWTTSRLFKELVMAFVTGQIDEVGWAFRKADKALQAKVKQFFEAEQKAPYSETNRRWKKTYGITLQDFIKFVATLDDP